MSSVYVPVVVEVAETIIQDVLDDYRVPEEKREAFTTYVLDYLASALSTHVQDEVEFLVKRYLGD